MERGSEDTAIRLILEGTAAETGDRFFAALVRKLADALGVAGVWVTEYQRDIRRLRALSFWYQGSYIPDYEYAVDGTPCELVVSQACMIHFAENIAPLFPKDTDLAKQGAVGYIGAPLLDVDGSVLGLLGALDTRPMPMRPRLEALFRIFAARAAAELQRQRAEQRIREREEKLSRLVDSALDAILELDSRLCVRSANRSAGSVFGCDPGRMPGQDFRRFLTPDSAETLERLTRELETRPPDRQFLWIAGGLKAVTAAGARFPAEASLSRFEIGGKSFYTVILRSIREQIEAERALERLRSESAYLKEEIEKLHNYREITGRSRPVREMLESVRQVAPTGAAVLICGETGTGKELVARAVHAASRRAHKTLVKVNCAAIPAALMESEFFGHERGAFTGATQRREGRFALADGGTIFLDEIGELPVDLQPKLLRVLQEGEFEPVGSSRARKVDVRAIAATNRDLEKAIREGRFREDLYYRLAVFPIRVPPLRDRGEDIELLAEVFARECGHKLGREVGPLSRESIRRLHAYDWPGNVRELQNVIERAVITSPDGELCLEPLLPQSRVPAVSPEPPERILSQSELRELERRNLVRALEQTGWRISGKDGAARLLGVPPSTLSSRLDALGIRRRAAAAPDFS
ncbi:MAG: sigma 54-interacting transcriptional regulator [Bryobacterales bacterium]|nr:sigma 54-interacting transcriptional regulator [Bryobacterales bacterium]